MSYFPTVVVHSFLANAEARPLIPEYTNPLLLAIDTALGAIALLLLGAAFHRWQKSRFGDPLRLSPCRNNVLAQESLFLVVGGYMLAWTGIVAIGTWLFGEDGSVSQELFQSLTLPAAGIALCLAMGSAKFTGGIRGFVFGITMERPRIPLGYVASVSVISVTLCPVVVLFTMLSIVFIMPGYELVNHPTLLALQKDGQSFFVLAGFWAGAAILAPVSEELFFRGLLQTFLARVTQRRWLAVVIIAMAFGAVHSNQPHVVPGLMVFGLLLGYAYEQTGTLLAPVLIHALFNLKTLVWAASSGV